MKSWILFTIIYAIFNGFFQCSKKKAIENNSNYEVLAFFTLVSFILVLFTIKDNILIRLPYLLIILGKSLIIVIAWFLNLYAISKMSISLYSVINLSRIIFSIILSILFLEEKLTLTTTIGIIIVITGLFLINNISNKNESKETSSKVIVVLLISCLLNSLSAIIDKKILLHITSEQLQFWFLFFLTTIYLTILFIKQHKINFKNINKNYWILITAICLVVGDKFLFLANSIPDSKVSIITILKQLSSIELIILGKFLFKEKNITKKLLCSILIIFGIILALI